MIYDAAYSLDCCAIYSCMHRAGDFVVHLTVCLKINNQKKTCFYEGLVLFCILLFLIVKSDSNLSECISDCNFYSSLNYWS